MDKVLVCEYNYNPVLPSHHLCHCKSNRPTLSTDYAQSLDENEMYPGSLPVLRWRNFKNLSLQYTIKHQKCIHFTYTCPGRKLKLIVGVCQFSTVICCHEHVRKSFSQKHKILHNMMISFLKKHLYIFSPCV